MKKIHPIQGDPYKKGPKRSDVIKSLNPRLIKSQIQGSPAIQQSGQRQILSEKPKQDPNDPLEYNNLFKSEDKSPLSDQDTERPLQINENYNAGIKNPLQFRIKLKNLFQIQTLSNKCKSKGKNPAPDQSQQPILPNEEPSSQNHILKQQNATFFRKMKRGMNRFNQQNRKRMLITISVVRRVAQNFLDLIRNRPLRIMNEYHLNIIGDQAYCPEEVKRFPQMEIVDHIVYIPVFHPNWLAMRIFDVIHAIVLMFSLVYYPLRIAFDEDLTNSYLIISKICIITQIVNIFLKLNSGIHVNGKFIKNRWLIIKLYFFPAFLVDLYGLLLEFGQNSSASLFFMVSMLVIRRVQIYFIISRLDYKYQLQQRYITASNICKLILLIFVFAHYNACCFYNISEAESKIPGNLNWITDQQLQDKSPFELYINALYFSFITMQTVGFGDIVPINMKEKVYVILMAIISCGVFAFSVNSVGQIFDQIAKRTEDFNRKRYLIMKFMNNRNINNDIKLDIIKYLEYQNLKENERNEYNQVDMILQSLTPELHQSIFNDYYGSILKKFSLFKNYFSDKFLIQLAMEMKELKSAPGDQIISQNDREHDSLFYVRDGVYEISLQVGSKIQVIGLARAGEFLGKINFFTENVPKIYLKSITPGQIIVLKKKDFIKNIREFPNDYESYRELIEKVQENNRILGLSCKICEKLTHDTFNCPYLQFVPQKHLLIGRFNFSRPQQRCHFQRNQKHKMYALSDKLTIKDALREFRVDLTETVIQGLDEICDAALDEPFDHDFYLQLPTLQRDGNRISMAYEDPLTQLIIRESYELQDNINRELFEQYEKQKFTLKVQSPQGKELEQTANKQISRHHQIGLSKNYLNDLQTLEQNMKNQNQQLLSARNQRNQSYGGKLGQPSLSKENSFSRDTALDLAAAKVNSQRRKATNLQVPLADEIKKDGKKHPQTHMITVSSVVSNPGASQQQDQNQQGNDLENSFYSVNAEDESSNRNAMKKVSFDIQEDSFDRDQANIGEGLTKKDSKFNMKRDRPLSRMQHSHQKKNPNQRADPKQNLKLENYIQNQYFKLEDEVILDNFDKIFEFRRYYPNFNFQVVKKQLDRLYYLNYAKFSILKLRSGVHNKTFYQTNMCHRHIKSLIPQAHPFEDDYRSQA